MHRELVTGAIRGGEIPAGNVGKGHEDIAVGSDGVAIQL